MLMRDRRLVGPDEPLDLAVPVLWDDRDGINACRSTSSLESAGGESSRCLYPKSENGNFHKQFLRWVRSLEGSLPNAIHLLPMLINKGGDSVRGYGI